MNGGVLGFPAQRADLGPLLLRAALKLVATSLTVDGLGPTATFKYPESAMVKAHNIEKVVYNATGDYTVHFAVPMPDAHFIVNACAKASGATELNVSVSDSDLGLADRVRLFVTSSAGGSGVQAPLLYVCIFA